MTSPLAADSPPSREARAGLADRLLSHYSPHEERPLGAYVSVAGTYAAATAGALLALRRARHELPERMNAADVLLIGVASHKVSRLIAKDKVTSFLRAPFTRFEESSGQGEVEEQPCGHGLRLAVGELLVCPYCLAQWVVTGFTVGIVATPRLTRLLGTMFAAHTISDFLQIVYRAAEERA